jgi:Flavodoxin
MEKVVVYKSKTGFTEKYARWIAEDLHCDAISMEEFKISQAAPYDVIVFGGAIHAGRIDGLNFILKHISQFSNKKLIVFATGATPPINEEVEKFRRSNFPNNLDIPFFYFQSGINYEKMRGLDKQLMKILKAVLKAKKDKSDIDQGTLDALQNSYDFSNRSFIEPLVCFINAK